MERTEKEIRSDLIDYITSNDKRWTQEDLNKYSITALTIMKTEIEIGMAQSKEIK
jgi:hypothetical protein